MQTALVYENSSARLIYPALNLMLYDRRETPPPDPPHSIREEWGDQQPRRLPPPYNGYRYQRILGDFYALQINGMDSEDAEWTYQPKTLQCLFEIKESLLAEKHAIKGGLLGETWLLAGRLATENQDPEWLAAQCYEALEIVDHLSWQEDLLGKGRILEATLFELWSPSAIEGKSSYHLYIVLFDYGASLKRLDRVYHHLLTLGLYRHQLTWGFQQAKAVCERLHTDYQTIRTLHQAARFNLEHPQVHTQVLAATLSQGLMMLSRYTEELNQLTAYLHLLETAQEQYRDRYRLLGKLDEAAQLSCLELFRNFALRRYVRPLKQDYTLYQPGLQMLINTIQIMQGRLHIEQVEQQYELERIAIAATVGLGTATVTGVAIAPHWVKARQLDRGSIPTWLQGLDILFILILSVLCGIGCASLAWQLLPKVLHRLGGARVPNPPAPETHSQSAPMK